MTAPAADCAIDRAASAPSPIRSGPGIPNINPSTGLSTDYLNHFAEAVMALEMAATMPECLDVLRAWRPKSYAEHFAASRFSNRSAVIEAYRASDPAVRQALDRASELLNVALAQARDEMLRYLASPAADALACRALDELRQLIVRTAALINDTATACDRQAPQAEIDAMFGR
jgi:hypothetical protein